MAFPFSIGNQNSTDGSALVSVVVLGNGHAKVTLACQTDPGSCGGNDLTTCEMSSDDADALAQAVLIASRRVRELNAARLSALTVEAD